MPKLPRNKWKPTLIRIPKGLFTYFFLVRVVVEPHLGSIWVCGLFSSSVFTCGAPAQIDETAPLGGRSSELQQRFGLIDGHSRPDLWDFDHLFLTGVVRQVALVLRLQ